MTYDDRKEEIKTNEIILLRDPRQENDGWSVCLSINYANNEGTLIHYKGSVIQSLLTCEVYGFD